MTTLRQEWARFGTALTTAENYVRILLTAVPAPSWTAARDVAGVSDRVLYALLENGTFVDYFDDADVTGTAKLVMALRAEEYALQVSADGRFQFVSVSPDVAALELDFDPAAGRWVTRVDGRDDGDEDEEADDGDE